MSDQANPWSLRDLPFAARLCLACFLVSVGVGYFSALVQLHFQHATPGDILPQPKNVVLIFHGPPGDSTPKSRLEMLIMADENLPWNGSGQMSAAFTTKSEGWKGELKKRGKQLAKKDGKDEPEDKHTQAAEKGLREERAGERDAIVAWLHAGAGKEEYEADKLELSGDLAKTKITENYVIEEGDKRYAKIQSILNERCARCHGPEGDPKLAAFPLNNFASVSKYTKVTAPGPAMSLEKLTQTTHVHLLAFSMLYMLTGVMLALTNYPGLVKIPLASIPLVAQLLDIACWWLARLPGEPGVRFAELIPVTGAVVGICLAIQILLTLFALFGRWGQLMLIVLMAGVGVGTSALVNKVILPHIEAEKAKKTE